MMAGVDPLVWILVGGLLMSAIAMTGALTLALKPATLERLLLPFVALAAGDAPRRARYRQRLPPIARHGRRRPDRRRGSRDLAYFVSFHFHAAVLVAFGASSRDEHRRTPATLMRASTTIAISAPSRRPTVRGDS
jgi:hypothetical protein